MKKNYNKVLLIFSLLMGVAVLFASFKGIFDARVYLEILDSGMIQPEMVWGSKAQDIISAVFGLIIILIAVLSIRKQNMIKQLFLIGGAWYFFYAFGLYVIQGAYTSIYPVYLIIFGLSIYAMIFGLVGISSIEYKNIELSNNLKRIISLFLLLIVIILTPAWIGQMLTDVAKRQPGNTYAVFIMDLAIVFPAMIITIYLLIKKHRIGIVLVGLCLIKTFTLCLSWTFAEWTQIIVDKPVNMPMALISLVLCFSALVLLTIYVRKIKTKQT